GAVERSESATVQAPAAFAAAQSGIGKGTQEVRDDRSPGSGRTVRLLPGELARSAHDLLQQPASESDPVPKSRAASAAKRSDFGQAPSGSGRSSGSIGRRRIRIGGGREADSACHGIAAGRGGAVNNDRISANGADGSRSGPVAGDSRQRL